MKFAGRRAQWILTSRSSSSAFNQNSKSRSDGPPLWRQADAAALDRTTRGGVGDSLTRSVIETFEKRWNGFDIIGRSGHGVTRRRRGSRALTQPRNWASSNDLTRRTTVIFGERAMKVIFASVCLLALTSFVVGAGQGMHQGRHRRRRCRPHGWPRQARRCGGLCGRPSRSQQAQPQQLERASPVRDRSSRSSTCQCAARR